MNLTDIINFLTTENVEVLNMGDHYVGSINQSFQAVGNTTLEAICNCYTKWKNIEQPSEAGMINSSQLSLPLNLKN